MCYVHIKTDQISKHGEELSADEWIRIGKEAFEAGTVSLCITGGEPLMHPEFVTIYKALAQMGFEITLQTNASLITDDIIELFNEYPPNLVKTTIYGSNDEIYKEVCGIENGFKRVNEGIQRIKKAGIPLMTVTTVIQQNREDLGAIYQYTAQQQIPWTYFASVKKSLRGAETDLKGVELEEELDIALKEAVKDMVSRPSMKDKKKPCEYCSGYKTSFWVTWDGKVRFCSFMNEPNISIRNRAFSEAWNDLIEYEQNLEWPEDCQTCEVRQYCRRCIGMLNTRSGSPAMVDKSFCDKIKNYIMKEKG